MKVVFNLGSPLPENSYKAKALKVIQALLIFLKMKLIQNSRKMKTAVMHSKRNYWNKSRKSRRRKSEYSRQMSLPETSKLKRK